MKEEEIVLQFMNMFKPINSVPFELIKMLKLFSEDTVCNCVENAKIRTEDLLRDLIIESFTPELSENDLNRLKSALDEDIEIDKDFNIICKKDIDIPNFKEFVKFFNEYGK